MRSDQLDARSPGLAGDDGRLVVRSVAAATFLQWAGASAVLPMLPLLLRRQGGSDALVGAVMGAFYLAGVLFQYPSGRLADRVGHRRALLAGLLTYAVASMAFLLPLDPAFAIGLRALQGIGAGAAEVAGLAMVAASVPVSRRGQAFGKVYGALVGGLAIGPLFGSLAGAAHINLVFVVAAASSVAACGPLWARRVAPRGRPRLVPGEPSESSRAPWRRPAVLGALVAAGVIGLTTGVYEACWTLLLHTRHAADWQVGLSWTLFAAPFVAMARPAGWLADHLDRRRLAVVALGSSAAFCALYPFVGTLWVILGMGVAEAVGAALAFPSVQSLLTEQVAPEHAGRAQGLFATAQTAATGLSAVVGGALYAVSPWMPFVSCALFAGLLVASLPWWWRAVAGRVATSALQVAHRPVEGLELPAPVLGGRHRAHHELGEPDRHELEQKSA